MRHAMVNESDGHKKVQRILDWLEIKSYMTLGTDREQIVSKKFQKQKLIWVKKEWVLEKLIKI